MVSQPTVLVVDDDSLILDSCRGMLVSRGYHALGASSGEEALAIAQRHALDVAVLDLLLPGMSGLEAWEHIKQVCPHAVGIVMSAYPSTDSAIDAVRRGVAGFLRKPFSLTELANTIGEVLQRRQLEEENARLRSTASLYEMTKALTGTLDVEQLMQIILHASLQEGQADTASLMLLDGKTETLTVRAAIGLPAEIVGTQVSLHDSIAGRVIGAGQPLLLRDDDAMDSPMSRSDKSERSDGTRPLLRRADIGSSLCVPLKGKGGKVIGVLNLNKMRRPNMTPFSEDDRNLIIFAATAAIGLENAFLHDGIRRAYLTTIGALAAAVEAKDPFMQGHSARVSAYAASLAEEMGMEPECVEGIRVAGLLHDIGKIGISESILLKPGPLTTEEFALIKTHPLAGVRILEGVAFPWDVVLPAVRHHHERWDGRGYPDGIAGEDIPLCARLLAVVDTFDAITTKRPFRDALSFKDAISVMLEVAGTQLDPVAVNHFINLLMERTPPTKEEVGNERRVVPNERRVVPVEHFADDV